MSSRERWTIYPLLLLAIGMGIKTRVSGIENAPSISCNSLTINGEDGKPVVRVHANTARQGQIEFYSPQGQLMLVAGTAHDGKAGQFVILNDNGKPQVEIGSDGHAGLLQTCGPDGLPQTMLRSSERGGSVVALRNDRKLIMMMGHDNTESGVLALNTETGDRAAVPFAKLPRIPAQDSAPENSTERTPDAKPPTAAEPPAAQADQPESAPAEPGNHAEAKPTAP